MIIKPALPIKGKPICVAPPFYGTLYLVYDYRNGAGYWLGKPVLSVAALCTVQRYDAMKMIRHDDELVKRGRCAVAGKALQAESRHIANGAKTANSISDFTQQVLGIFHADSNKIGVRRRIIKAPKAYMLSLVEHG